LGCLDIDGALLAPDLSSERLRSAPLVAAHPADADAADQDDE